jgi:hypothetical protein
MKRIIFNSDFIDDTTSINQRYIHKVTLVILLSCMYIDKVYGNSMETVNFSQ